MAFLRIDGWELAVSVENLSYTDTSVENFSRALGDTYQGLTYSEKDQISFNTNPLDLPAAHAVEGWVRGTKHLWTFSRARSGTTEFTRFSSDGGAVLSAGVSNATPLFGSFGLLLNSAATSTATVGFGSEGDWTSHVYHRVSAGSFVSYVTRSRAGVIDSWVDAATAATTRIWGHTAASGFLSLRLLGRDAAGAAATAQFSSLSLARFAYSDDQISAIANLNNLPPTGPTAAPYVVVTGDVLQRSGVAANGVGEPGPMVAKGFVDSFEVIPVVLNGAFRYNARRLRVRLVEK